MIAPPYFSNEKLVIDARLEPGATYWMKLFSAQGQLVRQQAITESRTLVPVAQCNTGLWLVCISDRYGNRETYRVIKL